MILLSLFLGFVALGILGAIGKALNNTSGQNNEDSTKYTARLTRRRLPRFTYRLTGEDEDNEYDDMYYIAGLAHHVDVHQVGAFVGFLIPEPDNAYDSDAVAIYDTEHLIGYIPAAIAADVKEDIIGDCPAVPCMGVIYLEGTTLRGRAWAAHPTTRKYLRDYFNSVAEDIKKEYGRSFNVPPLKFNCWLDRISPRSTTPRQLTSASFDPLDDDGSAGAR